MRIAVVVVASIIFSSSFAGELSRQTTDVAFGEQILDADKQYKPSWPLPMELVRRITEHLSHGIHEQITTLAGAEKFKRGVLFNDAPGFLVSAGHFPGCKGHIITALLDTAEVLPRLHGKCGIDRGKAGDK